MSLKAFRQLAHKYECPCIKVGGQPWYQDSLLDSKPKQVGELHRAMAFGTQDKLKQLHTACLCTGFQWVGPVTACEFQQFEAVDFYMFVWIFEEAKEKENAV